MGYATSWAVREVWKYGATQDEGLPAATIEEVDGDDFLAWAWEPVQEYLKQQKQQTFGEVMQAKADRMLRLLAKQHDLQEGERQ